MRAVKLIRGKHDQLGIPYLYNNILYIGREFRVSLPGLRKSLSFQFRHYRLFQFSVFHLFVTQ